MVGKGICTSVYWPVGGRRSRVIMRMGRARKALLLSCWVFNEVKRLPGLFLPAVVPAEPRYLALALCPSLPTIPPNVWANTGKNKSKASVVFFTPTARECKHVSICCLSYSDLRSVLIGAMDFHKCQKDAGYWTQGWNIGMICIKPHQAPSLPLLARSA